MKDKIIVTGANGQLGRELRDLCPAFPSFEFLFLSKEDLSIQDGTAVRAYFEDNRPAYCINCAAYTAVDKAEAEKDQALLINGEAVGFLSAACQAVNARFIHISTDYVFDGSSSTPLKEGDKTGPINVYGASKLAGEQLAFQYNPQTIVVRTSWVYSVYGHNFVKTMIRLMKEKDSINVINDQTGSPTYAADLATTILQIVSGGNFVPGIYHYSNEGQISWYDFAVAIKELTGSACKVNPIPSSAYPTPAKRPRYSLLDKGLIMRTYGIKIPGWRESLAICIESLKQAAG